MKKLLTGLTTAALVMFALLVFGQIIDESEPNETAATAQIIAVGDTLRGRIAAQTDADYFKIQNLPRGVYVLHMDYPANPQTRDWWRILDAQGNEIAHECYYPGGAVHLAFFKICQPGDVFVEVKFNQDFGLSNVDYLFSINPDLDPDECNDTPATARVVNQPDVFLGKFALRGDPDFFKIKNAAAGAFSAAANTPLQPGLAFEISLYLDPNAAPIATAPAGQNSLDANLAQAGNYYLLVKYANPDTGSMHPYAVSLAYQMGSGSCQITVDSAATVVQPSICGQATGSVSIPAPTDGVAPFQYSLDGGQPQALGVFNNLPEGVYSVLVADADSCTAEFSVEVTCTPCPPLVVGISANPLGKVVSFQSAVQGGAATDFLWNFGDGSTSTDANPTHTYTINGVYTVILTVGNGCTNSTAQAQVTAISATFEAGKVEGNPGDTVLVPVISKDFEGVLTYIQGGHTFDLNVGKFVGLASGKATISLGNYNPAAGIFSYIFVPNGVNIGIGDTVFFVKILLTGAPGDTSALDLNGAAPFQIGAALTGAGSIDVPTSFVAGQLKVREKVKVSVAVTSMKGLPVSNATVQISNGDSTITALTNVMGIAQIEIGYRDTLTISCEKDTSIRVGITPNDAYDANRLLVFLPVIGSNQYTYVAANFDCGAFTPNDVVKLMQWIVGLIDLPCAPQLVFIPADYQFPAYPNANYFKHPTQKQILLPKPTETANFVVVVRGDTNGSANPSGFAGDSDDRSGSTATWQFFTEIFTENFAEKTGDLLRVSLLPDAAHELVAGGLNLRFDREKFDFVRAEFSQAKNEHLLVAHEKSGNLKLAFINKNGNTAAAWDARQPLLELVFRPKTAAATAENFDLKIEKTAAGGLRSQTFDALGEAVEIALERAEKQPFDLPAEPNFFPNPANTTLFVNLPTRGSARIELFDLTGNRRAELETRDRLQAEIPVADLPAGLYLARVSTGGKTFTRKVKVAH